MNLFAAIGRLTADPKANKTKNGTEVSSFILAIPKGKEETDFLRCIAWDKTAAVINAHVKKGDQIGISGSVHSRSYEDENGTKQYVVEVLVTGMDFCQAKGTGKKEAKKEEKEDLPFDVLGIQ